MKKALSLLAFIVLASMLSGCSMLKPAANAAMSLGGAAKPEYKSTLEQISKILGGSTAATAPAGYSYRVEYRYKGAQIDASDLTWEEAFYRIGSADKAIPPTSSSNAVSSSSSEARIRAEIEAILKAAGVGDDK